MPKEIVPLQVIIERTGVVQSEPCYILDSSKLIWQGEFKDCGIIIGMNALEELEFSIVDSDGKVLKSSKASRVANTKAEKTSDLTDTGPAIKESMETSDSANQVNTVPEKATDSEDPMTQKIQ